MSKKLLCPSMMCADYTRLREEVRALEEAGADVFHCDVMDGCFVPNFALGTADVRAIRRCTSLPIDCHLMIENPGGKVDWFIDAGADIVYIHAEAERYVCKTLAHIRERGARAGLAVNPDTSVSTIEEMLNLCDDVLVMTVNPGFAGQKLVDFTRGKVERLARMKEKYGYRLSIDGHCSPEVIAEFSGLGADGFVLGTSALFGKDRSYTESMQSLRAL